MYFNKVVNNIFIFYFRLTRRRFLEKRKIQIKNHRRFVKLTVTLISAAFLFLKSAEESRLGSGPDLLQSLLNEVLSQKRRKNNGIEHCESKAYRSLKKKGSMPSTKQKIEVQSEQAKKISIPSHMTWYPKTMLKVGFYS